MLTRQDLRGGRLDPDALRARDVSDVASDTVAAVREIIAAVRTSGDAALRDLTERFDGVRVDHLQVPPEDVEAARRAASPELLRALEYANDAIRAYHEAQRPEPGSSERDGISVRERVVPVDRAGCYVPGGRAAYPSTVLMTVTPARVAGVREVVLCVPPADDGRVAAPTLAAAAVAGADSVFRLGGAQAVAAMAYGTESVPRVDVVVGPGNVFVALAKREVAGLVGVDSIAGPSEIVVVADGDAVPEHVAVDLLAQAEHGPGGSAVLVTWSVPIADAVDDAIEKLLADAPRRAEIEATLRTGGRCVLVDGPDQALAVVDELAPEHLELLTTEADTLASRVRNAGAVFCGDASPAVLGDYVAGVNHVLPTNRSARFASALRVDHFVKRIHVVRTDVDALRRVAPHVRAIAEAEGLAEHARSVSLRITP